jgi:hypothetical protein
MVALAAGVATLRKSCDNGCRQLGDRHGKPRNNDSRNFSDCEGSGASGAQAADFAILGGNWEGANSAPENQWPVGLVYR